ncbi:MAG TPA: DoxX family protein [Candidatus Polarisedimenticolia bacterium]|nr:DoxX family protein [Candidatus Polarisedimenticolia bacterium]
MRRLFSSFARGWPGVGLLVLRVAAGSSLIARAILVLGNTLTLGTGFFQLFIATAGLLLIIGLWTPVVATVMVLLELWRIISRHGDPASDILLCALAFAIALLGPGAWSVDARLFGWKRIEIDTQKNKR